MRLTVAILLMAVVCSMLVGCAGIMLAPVVPPPGFIYTNRAAPISIGPAKTPANAKEGRASTESILGLVSWGDGSVETAAKNGSVSKVNHIDYHLYNILGVYSKYTTIVYGE